MPFSQARTAFYDAHITNVSVHGLAMKTQQNQGFLGPRRPAAPFQEAGRAKLFRLEYLPSMSKLTLTPEMLEGAYEYLRVSPPFCSWDLPHADQVMFRVLGAKDRY